MSGQFLFYHGNGNEAIHCDKCSDDEPPNCNVPGWQRHCDESVNRNSVRIIRHYDVTASGSCIDDVANSSRVIILKSYRERIWMNDMIFVNLRLYENLKYKWIIVISIVNITRGWTHVRDARFLKFHCRNILHNHESFCKWLHNLLATSNAHGCEKCIWFAKRLYIRFRVVEYLVLWKHRQIMLWNRETYQYWYLQAVILGQHIFVLPSEKRCYRKCVVYTPCSWC